jgi:hypothetical protein
MRQIECLKFAFSKKQCDTEKNNNLLGNFSLRTGLL